MPLYAYSCPNCRTSVEMFIHMSQRDSQWIRCPRCSDANHAVQMKREISKPALSGLESRDYNDFKRREPIPYNDSDVGDYPTFNINAGELRERDAEKG